jgi:hypothetical protein
MDNENEQVPGESLADDIFGTGEYKPVVPLKREFQPWHRPRKQYVRHEQWCAEIKGLISGFVPDGNTLKYLGLPGKDMLDIRYFHDEICKPSGMMLQYLGFNNDGNSRTKKEPGVYVSVDEVNKLEFISDSSDMISDNFCQIADENSIAAARCKEMGTFDVINIDLCDGIGKESHKFLKTHYSTLLRLMTLQSRRANPWLLFITTRTGPEHTHEEVFGLLKVLYGKNLIDCEAFSEASANLYKIFDEASLDEAVNTGKGMSDVFVIALCKWIASLGLDQNPKANIEVQSVYAYKVNKGNDYEDLLSISLKITPTDIGAIDQLGLAQPVASAISECTTAVKALKTVYGQLNVDEILASSPEIKQSMVEATSNLLKLARYDVSGYDAKVAEWGN